MRGFKSASNLLLFIVLGILNLLVLWLEARPQPHKVSPTLVDFSNRITGDSYETSLIPKSPSLNVIIPKVPSETEKITKHQISLIPPLISPPSTGLPLPPNPLQPTPLLPNPLQPPSTGLIPPLPSLPLPPVPGLSPPPPPASSLPLLPLPLPPLIPGIPVPPGLVLVFSRKRVRDDNDNDNDDNNDDDLE